MLMVAVARYMYDITHSGWYLGLVGLFQFVPALLLTLPTGDGAHRYHQGCIFALCMLAQTLTPLMVATEPFQRATALSSSGMQAAIICGPALGGYSMSVVRFWSTLAVPPCYLAPVGWQWRFPIRPSLPCRRQARPLFWRAWGLSGGARCCSGV